MPPFLPPQPLGASEGPVVADVHTGTHGTQRSGTEYPSEGLALAVDVPGTSFSDTNEDNSDATLSAATSHPKTGSELTPVIRSNESVVPRTGPIDDNVSDPTNGHHSKDASSSSRFYDCHMCGWRFSLKGNLAAHIRRHTGEKPYVCTMCLRRFTQSSLLTVHMRTHTGEKPFECTVCHRSFSRSGNLRTHMRTHSDVKPYECAFCHKRFAQRVNMELHTRVHTGVKPYRCGVCDRAFTSCSNMRRHWRQIHPDYPEPAMGTTHLQHGMPEKSLYTSPVAMVGTQYNNLSIPNQPSLHPMHSFQSPQVENLPQPEEERRQSQQFQTQGQHQQGQHQQEHNTHRYIQGQQSHEQVHTQQIQQLQQAIPAAQLHQAQHVAIQQQQQQHQQQQHQQQQQQQQQQHQQQQHQQQQQLQQHQQHQQQQQTHLPQMTYPHSTSGVIYDTQAEDQMSRHPDYMMPVMNTQAVTPNIGAPPVNHVSQFGHFNGHFANMYSSLPPNVIPTIATQRLPIHIPPRWGVEHNTIQQYSYPDNMLMHIPQLPTSSVPPSSVAAAAAAAATVPRGLDNEQAVETPH